MKRREDRPPTIGVHYPFSGRRFLLLWCTENEGNHLVVARSRRAMAIAARGIVAKHRAEARFLEAHNVELIGPSLAFRAEVANAKREEAIERFRWEASLAVSDLFDAGRPIPAPFAACEASVSDGDKRHAGCNKCMYGVRLIGMTPETLFGTFAARWATTMRQPRRLRSSTTALKPCPAAPSDAENQLAAVARFGDHRKGIVIGSPASVSDAMNDNVLFWYRPILPAPNMKPFLEMSRRAVDAEKRRRQRSANVARAKSKKEREERLRKLEKFFANGRHN